MTSQLQKITAVYFETWTHQFMFTEEVDVWERFKLEVEEQDINWQDIRKLFVVTNNIHDHLRESLIRAEINNEINKESAV